MTATLPLSPSFQGLGVHAPKISSPALMWRKYVPLAQADKEPHRLWERAVRKPAEQSKASCDCRVTGRGRNMKMESASNSKIQERKALMCKSTKSEMVEKKNQKTTM